MGAHIDPAAAAIAAAALDPTGATSAAPAAAAPLYEFDEDFQTKVCALTLRDSHFAQITAGLVRPEYFADAAEAALVNMAGTYFAAYKKAPDFKIWGQLLAEAIKAKRVRQDLVPELRTKIVALLQHDISDRDYVAEQVATFAKNQSMEAALYRIAAELLPKRDFAAIDKLMSSAMMVGISEDAGEYDYYERIDARTQKRKEIGAGTYAHDGVPTGWPELDKLLYHRGFGRKELFVWMAPAKGGKSIALWDCAKNASLAGYNVLGLTCEVSAEIIADRIDASLSDTLMKELVTSPFAVADAVKKLHAKAGVLKIHEYATGTLKPSQIRRLLETYKAKGIVFDMLVVDYADIMAPEHRTDSNIENSKSIYVDLRGITFDYNLAGVTATQTNRDGAKATVATATDVAEDFNKIRIADAVVSINATDAEKGIGEARLFFAAIRNGDDGFTLNIKQDRARMKFITKVLGRS